jgi:hypothetical protein
MFRFIKAFSLALEDALGLSTFVLVSPHYGVHSNDTGRPVVGGAVLPFLPLFPIVIGTG